MPDDNPFEPEETREQQDRRIGAMIRENVERRKRPFTLRLALGNDVASGWVNASLSAEDIALPFEDFCMRYLQPAYEQAKREFDYQIELHTEAIQKGNAGAGKVPAADGPAPATKNHPGCPFKPGECVCPMSKTGAPKEATTRNR